MLKSYNDLRKIDVLPYCDMRETKDEQGKKIKVPYLNWAKCKDLLHENGAQRVYYEPLVDERSGSTVFMSAVPFVDSKGNTNRCFEVRVKVVIDDMEFVQNYPLLNGVYVVRDDTINQLRVSNAQARAFVKGVAIHTGLGFGLWVKDDETTGNSGEEDLYFHNIMKVKERMERLVTIKLDGGLTIATLCEKLGIDEDQFNVYMRQYSILDRLEKAIQKL